MKTNYFSVLVMTLVLFVLVSLAYFLMYGERDLVTIVYVGLLGANSYWVYQSLYVMTNFKWFVKILLSIPATFGVCGIAFLCSGVNPDSLDLILAGGSALGLGFVKEWIEEFVERKRCCQSNNC